MMRRPPPLPPSAPPAHNTLEPWAAAIVTVLLLHVILKWLFTRPNTAQAPLPSDAIDDDEADPRYQLLHVAGSTSKSPAASEGFFFSVWRPTSEDAIKMMMEGKATGKGLNVKGKSAKKGRLSGFVPFLQISDEAHKLKIGTSPPYTSVRVYYASAALREAARNKLQPLLEEMVAIAEPSVKALEEEAASGVDLPTSEHLMHVKNLKYRMEDPILKSLDECEGAWGLEMPERLLMECYVQRQDISHPSGWETGRASEPDYMDMNLMSTRKSDPEQPKVVVYQHDEVNAMNPRGLLVAYEENGRVQPVASDFDAFLFGSRGLTYPIIPPKDLPFLKAMLGHLEDVLASPDERSWTHRWLSVLKGEVELRDKATGTPMHSAIAGSYGKKRQDGKYGFGDGLTQEFIEHLMHHSSVVKSHGAVRHAAENVNYYFPQELDDEFLVLWHGYDPTIGPQRRYLSPSELRAFLIDRVHEGYSFPLNPTWILRDEGWYDVYDALTKSAECKASLDAWLPPESGLRERIEAIHAAYPRGFVRTSSSTTSPFARSPSSKLGKWRSSGKLVRLSTSGIVGSLTPRSNQERVAEEAYEAADLALRRHMAFKRAKFKTRAILLWAANEKKKGKPFGSLVMSGLNQSAANLLGGLGSLRRGSLTKQATRMIGSTKDLLSALPASPKLDAGELKRSFTRSFSGSVSTPKSEADKADKADLRKSRRELAQYRKEARKEAGVKPQSSFRRPSFSRSRSSLA